MPFTDLTPPPEPPTRSDPPDEFIVKADAFVAWIAQHADDLTTFIAELETAAALIAAAPAYADPTLKTIADSGLTPAADRGVYFTSGSAAALFTLTAAARGLLDDTTVSDMLTTLGLSANGKSLVTAADYAAMRTLLSVYTAAQVDSAVAAAQAAATAAARTPAGTVISVAMSSAPTGYLKCNGAAVSRTTYADLFAAISTTYGVGDGSTTFNLPELRGEFVRGWDDGRGIDSGRAIGTAQADELEAHTHTIPAGTGASQLESGAGGVGSSFNTGSTGGTETRPRNVALLMCIKT